MSKSPEAFRTISEVAEWLGVQAHVLRFWESKFSQVKPIKRAGGRRYYRPSDMLLLSGIKKLLHVDGLTIKGVQKVLREEGMSHVAALSAPLDDATLKQMPDAAQSAPDASEDMPAPMIEEAEEERGVVLSFDTRDGKDIRQSLPELSNTSTPAAEPPMDPPSNTGATPEPDPTTVSDIRSEAAASLQPEEKQSGQQPDPEDHHPAAAADDAQDDISSPLPSFLRRPLDDTAPVSTDNTPSSNNEPVQEAPPPQEPEPEPQPRPREIDVGPFTPEAEFGAGSGTLSAAFRIRRLERDQARQIAPLLDRLASLREDMSARRRNAPQSGAND